MTLLEQLEQDWGTPEAEPEVTPESKPTPDQQPKPFPGLLKQLQHDSLVVDGEDLNPVADWIRKNPYSASSVINFDEPAEGTLRKMASRKAFKDAGLPKMNAEERQKYAVKMQKAMKLDPTLAKLDVSKPEPKRGIVTELDSFLKGNAKGLNSIPNRLIDAMSLDSRSLLRDEALAGAKKRLELVQSGNVKEAYLDRIRDKMVYDPEKIAGHKSETPNFSWGADAVLREIGWKTTVPFFGKMTARDIAEVLEQEDRRFVTEYQTNVQRGQGEQTFPGKTTSFVGGVVEGALEYNPLRLSTKAIGMEAVAKADINTAPKYDLNAKGDLVLTQAGREQKQSDTFKAYGKDVFDTSIEFGVGKLVGVAGRAIGKTKVGKVIKKPLSKLAAKMKVAKVVDPVKKAYNNKALRDLRKNFGVDNPAIEFLEEGVQQIVNDPAWNVEGKEGSFVDRTKANAKQFNEDKYALGLAIILSQGGGTVGGGAINHANRKAQSKSDAKPVMEAINSAGGKVTEKEVTDFLMDNYNNDTHEEVLANAKEFMKSKSGGTVNENAIDRFADEFARLNFQPRRQAFLAALQKGSEGVVRDKADEQFKGSPLATEEYGIIAEIFETVSKRERGVDGKPILTADEVSRMEKAKSSEDWQSYLDAAKGDELMALKVFEADQTYDQPGTENVERSAKTLASLARRMQVSENDIARLPKEVQEELLNNEEFAQELSAKFLAERQAKKAVKKPIAKVPVAPPKSKGLKAVPKPDPKPAVVEKPVEKPAPVEKAPVLKKIEKPAVSTPSKNKGLKPVVEKPTPVKKPRKVAIKNMGRVQLLEFLSKSTMPFKRDPAPANLSPIKLRRLAIKVDNLEKLANPGQAFGGYKQGTGHTDLIDKVMDAGGIVSKGAMKKQGRETGGEYDEQPSVPALGGFGKSVFTKSEYGSTVDQVMAEVGFKGTSSEFWSKITAEVAGYAKAKANGFAEAEELQLAGVKSADEQIEQHKKDGNWFEDGDMVTFNGDSGWMVEGNIMPDSIIQPLVKLSVSKTDGSDSAEAFPEQLKTEVYEDADDDFSFGDEPVVTRCVVREPKAKKLKSDPIGKSLVKSDLAGEVSVSAMIAKIKRAKGAGKDRLYLSVYGDERKSVLSGMILTMEDSSYVRDTDNDYGNSLTRSISEKFGAHAGADLTQKFMRGMESLYPDRVSVSFTLGLDEVRLFNVKKQKASAAVEKPAPKSKGLKPKQAEMDVGNDFKMEIKNDPHMGVEAQKKHDAEVAKSKADADKAQDKLDFNSSPKASKSPANPNPRHSIDDFVPSEKIHSPDQIKLYEQALALVKKYAGGGRVMEGRNPSGTLGVYYTKSTNIALNALNQISVAVHEATHGVDAQIGFSDKITSKKNAGGIGKNLYAPSTLVERQQLTQVYVDFYPGGKKNHAVKLRVVEGYATFVQEYIKDPGLMIRRFPELTKMIVVPGGKYYSPLMGGLIKDARLIVDTYHSLDSLQKIGTRIKNKHQVHDDRFLNTKDRVETWLFDAIWPMEKMAIVAGEHFTPNDPSLYVREYEKVSRVVAHNINVNILGSNTYMSYRNGKMEVFHDFNWGTILKGLHKTGMEDTFSQYLIARRTSETFKVLDELQRIVDKKDMEVAKIDEAMKVEGLDPKDLATLKKDLRQAVAEHRMAEQKRKALNDILDKDNMSRSNADSAVKLAKKQIPDIDKTEDMFDKLVRADLDLMLEVGLITPEAHTKYAGRKGYVTFMRDMYDDLYNPRTGALAGQSQMSSKTVKSTKKRTGSERTIIDPIYASIANHDEITRKAMRQEVWNKVGALADKVPGLMQQEKLVTIVDKTTGAISYPQDNDTKIVMARKNGKRIPYEINAEIKTHLDMVLTPKSVDLAEQLLTGASRLFTKGTTGLYPAFAAMNIIVDQFSATAQSRTGYIPIVTQVKLLAHSLRDEGSQNSKYIKEYLTLAGATQTLTGWNELSPDAAKKVMRKEHKALDFIIKAYNAGETALGAASQASEIFTRASEYMALRIDGDSQFAALEKAGRVTASFHHHGSIGGSIVGQTVIKSIPYVNSGLQVGKIYAKSAFSDDPKIRRQVALVTALIMGAKIAELLPFMYAASDDQKEKYKNIHPDYMTQYIFLPHPNGIDLLKFRVPDQMNALSSVLNMVLQNAMMDNNYDGGDMKDAAIAWVPDQFDFTEPVRCALSWMPQLIKPGLEVAFNKRTFPKVMPLETPGIERQLPQYRTYKNTSKIAKVISSVIGEKTGLSPIKVDHLLRGYWGRTVKLITNPMQEWRKTLNPFKLELYFSAGRNVQNFYEQARAIENKISSIKDGNEKVTPAEKFALERDMEIVLSVKRGMRKYRKVEDINGPQARALRSMMIDSMDSLGSGESFVDHFPRKSRSKKNRGLK